jgi:hypothetical protein
MEGLVAVLNQEMKARGEHHHYTLVSRTVKRVYDMVHDQYDGTWDEGEGAYVDPRTTFFEPQEILEMAMKVEQENRDEEAS